MNEQQRKRRLNHYGATSQNEPEKKKKTEVLLQLIICMTLIFAVFWGNSNNLPYCNKIYDFTKKYTRHNMNILPAVESLKKFVGTKIDVPSFPQTQDGTVFTESTINNGEN